MSLSQGGGVDVYSIHLPSSLLTTSVAGRGLGNTYSRPVHCSGLLQGTISFSCLAGSGTLPASLSKLPAYCMLRATQPPTLSGLEVTTYTTLYVRSF